MRAALVVSMCCVLMGACTTITLNDDNTNTITHKEGEGVARDLAARACHKAGERRAVIISTMNKDPSKPEGEGRQVTTFRCTSQEPHASSQ